MKLGKMPLIASLLVVFLLGRVPALHASEPAPSVGPRAVASPAPTPAGFQISSGKKVLELNSEKFTFEHVVSEALCSGGVESRIIWMPPGNAVITRKNCAEIEPQTLVTSTFWTMKNDLSVLVFNNVLFQRNDGKSDLTIEALCNGGNDSQARPLAVEVKRQISSGNHQVKLVYVAESNRQPLIFWVQRSSENRFTIYQTGPAMKRPYLKFSLGNLSGLTGIVSYDFDAAPPGKPATAYKETMVTLPHCYFR